MPPEREYRTVHTALILMEKMHGAPKCLSEAVHPIMEDYI